MDPRLGELLERLQRTGFADVKGTRMSLHVPVSERLLNDLVRDALPPGGALNDVRLRPHAGNRIDVQVKLARPAFLPPINVTAVIEQQPELPQPAELVLRLSSIPGVLSLAGGAAAFFNVLPPGVRMQGDRVLVNVAELAHRRGQQAIFELVRRLHVLTEEGALVLELDLAV